VVEVNRQTKTLAFEQIVFTKDNVQFVIDTVVFYRVFDSAKLAYRLGILQGG
jgi:regulator of protease activity HflC (stomatin/prohibitin superfamily)